MDGEIDPDTLRDRLEAPEGAEGAASDGDLPLIVDIRSPHEFAEGHLPGSTNVPLAELPQKIDRIAEADEVVTVCHHGLASVKAARIVGAYTDFDGRVESLEGGLEAWDGSLATDETDDERSDAPF